MTTCECREHEYCSNCWHWKRMKVRDWWKRLRNDQRRHARNAFIRGESVCGPGLTVTDEMLANALGGDYTWKQKVQMILDATNADYVPGRGQRPKLSGLFTTSFVTIDGVRYGVREVTTETHSGSMDRRRQRRRGVRNAAARTLSTVVNCAYCDRVGTMTLDADSQTWHLDHVVPLDRNGPDETWNLVKACQRCNLRKGTSYDLPQHGTVAGDGRLWAFSNYLPVEVEVLASMMRVRNGLHAV